MSHSALVRRLVDAYNRVSSTQSIMRNLFLSGLCVESYVINLGTRSCKYSTWITATSDTAILLLLFVLLSVPNLIVGSRAQSHYTITTLVESNTLGNPMLTFLSCLYAALLNHQVLRIGFILAASVSHQPNYFLIPQRNQQCRTTFRNKNGFPASPWPVLYPLEVKKYRNSIISSYASIHISFVYLQNGPRWQCTILVHIFIDDCVVRALGCVELQALYFCEPLRHHLAQVREEDANDSEGGVKGGGNGKTGKAGGNNNSVLSQLAELFWSISKQKRRSGHLAPTEFLRTLRERNELFRGNMQQVSIPLSYYRKISTLHFPASVEMPLYSFLY